MIIGIKRIFNLIILLCAGLFLITAVNPVQSQSEAEIPLVILLKYEGPVTPVLYEYIERGIETARDRNAAAIVLELNTPGGSVDLMNKVVSSIRNSPVPVVVYVAPRNAMAASAGTVITLAGHMSAMAPETTIGAASPVGSQGEDIGKTMESKTKEMLKANVRALAANRSLDAIHLAEETIDSAKAVTVDEAINAGLIDIKADDIPDLLNQLDGKIVRVGNTDLELETTSAEIDEVPYTLTEQILKTLVNPNLIFLFLAVGIQAILIELSNPGAWVPGFIGVSSLLLAIYGLGILPVNWFGILFMILAFVLFVLEIKTPTLGGLTIAGAVSFITGALILFNSLRIPGFPTVSVPLVIGTGIFIALSFLGIVSFAIKAQRSPIRIGKESLPGKTGIVTVDLDPSGQVQVAGELWSAALSGKERYLERGSRIEVVRVHGLQLIVRGVERQDK